MQPLAITVVGGLTVSTLLTLIVVPCAYLVVHRVAELLRRVVVGAPRPSAAADAAVAPAPATPAAPASGPAGSAGG